MSRMVGGTFGVAAMGALITTLGQLAARRPAARDARGQIDRLADALGAGGAGLGGRPARRAAGLPRRGQHGLKIGSRVALVGALVAWLLIDAIRAEAPADAVGERIELDLVEAGDAERRRARPLGRGRRRRRSAVRPPPLASAAPCRSSSAFDVDEIRALLAARRALLAATCARPTPTRCTTLGELLGLRPTRDRGLDRVRPAPEARRLRRLRAARLLRRAHRATPTARCRAGRGPLPRHRRRRS